MAVIGHILDRIAKIRAHLVRDLDAIGLFHDIGNAALSGLAVDTDHIAVIGAPYILRIDRQVRNSPV